MLDLSSYVLFRFHPVVGGGANGSVIHYSRNDQKVRPILALSFLLIDIKHLSS